MGEDGEVCVLIPTLDEAETIGDVIAGLHEAGLENVLVVDGHSTDDTVEIAANAGARVITQSGSGKGQAVREAIEQVEAEFVLMLDGDGTYVPSQADRLLEPLRAGEADHVVGNRFADMESGAMTRLNKVGNRLFNRVFRGVHGEDHGDILSGYRAFTRDSFERMHLSATGFGIETEMAVECVKRGLEVSVVPITYRARPAGSDPNLNPIADGGRILLTLYSLAKTTNPLFYFGSVGGLIFGAGLLFGGYVGVEYFTQNVSHEIIAVLATLAILLGGQLILFGFLADMLASLHRERLRRLDEIADRLEELEE
ncbi:S-layer glycoprotein N-glycosyltransferase AglJ [Halodesulfurarchaeum formicicum]|uniref:Glycosyl transferase family 2 n=1 Tax=Halodesulfurarchaeum formicicum TaxID=1873524 RepID=A0A1J1AC59_9EURY|nr:S-layer glycoprotein N-glycosyltransferase AglJ [Halodesulfurarchaeum formicicum]APE95360.1 glycosyl transferase family 2 [Halodesulfurarchaeum formicicum]